MNTAQHAQLALLLEVASTPKPGNVDRWHDYPSLRFEHFLAGAVGAYDGLVAAMEGDAIGDAFATAIAGMSQQEGGNTQFGAILLLVPLIQAAASTELHPSGVDSVVRSTTIHDAIRFYESFEYVSVAVDDPPAELQELDVRRGREAADALRAQDLRLIDVMELSASYDGVAREWINGFERSFRAGEYIMAGDGTVLDNAASCFLELLAEEPDTFIVKQHDEETARDVTNRAVRVLDGESTPAAFADKLVEEGINPGTTADIIAGGLFIAVERGMGV